MTRCKCAELLRPVPRETPHHEVVAGVVANSTGLSQAEALFHIIIPNLQVEDAEALCEFDGITAAADGIILSRGNLGLDVASHLLQNCHGKTLLLHSFDHAYKPTAAGTPRGSELKQFSYNAVGA